ncbi:MAG: SusC/RagA family TonB-linked outer membrane protein, partial [Niabella sp.]
MKQILVLMAALLCGSICISQNLKNIAITVTDMDGNPLAKATAIASQSKKSAISNDKGDLHLTNVIIGEQITISMIGHKSSAITVGSASNVTVQLEAILQTLDDVVVIGYGQVNRKDLTGSVGSASIEDMKKAPVVSFEDALAGRVAGVQVNSSDGQPGMASSITIRGANSITQSNAPLYVIDGFPLEDPDNNTLDPGDIESIEVLKDASATAIYGARGANGVIIITTKGGKSSKPVVNYNGWMGQQRTIGKQAMLDPYEYVKYQLELNPVNNERIFLANGRTLDSYRNVEGIDWQDLLISPAFKQNHSLSIRGGTDKTKYSLSGSYLDQKGVIMNSGFTRFQGRIKLDQTINSNLKIGINTNYSRTKTFGDRANQTDDNSGSATSYQMFSIWGYRPVSGSDEGDEALLDEGLDPDVAPTSDFRFNPLLRARNIYNPSFNTTMITNAHIEYRFLNDFRLRIAGGYTQTDIREENFYNSNTPQGSPLTLRGSTNGVNGRIRNNRFVSWVNENTLNYKKAIKGHTFEGVAGYTLQKNKRASDGYSSILLPNESLGINGLSEGTFISGIATASLSTMESYLGRINYHYKSRYYLTASFRADGSSKFHRSNRWGYFPSAAVAWNFGKEDLIKKISFISNGKLRMSYGLTGNNRVSDFAYLPALRINLVGANSANTTSSYAFNNTPMMGAVPASIGNENLKWETTAQTDIGIDLGFFSDRIAITADYYYKNTKDLLLNAAIAPSTGYMTAFKNIGNVSNRGFEFSLNTINVNGRVFQWSSNFNISFNRNK